ncbi:O-antigen ligase family protein [Candidatus Microgenomates bacterium]|nr:O-antigen ligase family protein [Candidatus Microgenomates bacterium]
MRFSSLFYKILQILQKEKSVETACNKVMEIGFYALFGLIPLILTPINYELFEYNKMMAVYALTAVIVFTWIIKSVSSKKIIIRRTPLDLFFLLFLGSQFLSTLFSMDIHTSIWGYYSRFHQGLLASISYFLLYLAFVSNFDQRRIIRLLSITLLTATLVSVYGILEHFGIDKNLWVQDVQNRVFSTFGQPNWLAAYLAVLIPLSIGMAFSKLINFENENPNKGQGSPASPSEAGRAKVKSQSQKLKIETNWSLSNLKLYIVNCTLYILPLVFYLTLLFTKSRSGFIAFWLTNVPFSVLLFLFLNKLKNVASKRLIFLLLFLNIAFVAISFIVGGAGLGSLEKYSLPGLMSQTSQVTAPTRPSSQTSLETGITESGDIRKIVWKGAMDAFLANPLLGTGVETFAYAYYQFRPAAHNMTSEWDFLYNKAHNEYLNFAATTGILGLGTYLLFIFAFTAWFIRRFLTVKPDSDNFTFYILHFSLFFGWLSILITNFFGFSVVVIGLFFFLLPAVIFFLTETRKKELLLNLENLIIFRFEAGNRLIIALVFFSLIYALYLLKNLWMGDVAFAKGYRDNRAGRFLQAYQNLSTAVTLNPYEPFYADEISYSSAVIAVALNQEGNATQAAVLKDQSLAFSKVVETISPNNINFLKSRVKTYYVLSEIDPALKEAAVSFLFKAEKLAPTDPKIPYNLGVLLAKSGQVDMAVEKLKKAIELKPNYRDAYYALGLLQKDNGEVDEAKKTLQFVLDKINKDDTEIKNKLKEWEEK